MLVGSSDGRIFKYVGPSEGFKEYAYTSPNRYIYIYIIHQLLPLHESSDYLLRNLFL